MHMHVLTTITAAVTSLFCGGHNILQYIALFILRAMYLGASASVHLTTRNDTSVIFVNS